MHDSHMYIVILLLGVFISSVSQVLLKKAAERQYAHWWQAYLNPSVIIAYGIFFAATFCSIFAYRGIPLSLGPVLEATSYLYVTIFGVTIFHEKLNARKLLALVLIIGGIAIYAAAG